MQDTVSRVLRQLHFKNKKQSFYAGWATQTVLSYKLLNVKTGPRRVKRF